jgi:hypothetical protein
MGGGNRKSAAAAIERLSCGLCADFSGQAGSEFFRSLPPETVRAALVFTEYFGVQNF